MPIVGDNFTGCDTDPCSVLVRLCLLLPSRLLLRLYRPCPPSSVRSGPSGESSARLTVVYIYPLSADEKARLVPYRRSFLQLMTKTRSRTGNGKTKSERENNKLRSQPVLSFVQLVQPAPYRSLLPPPPLNLSIFTRRKVVDSCTMPGEGGRAGGSVVIVYDVVVAVVSAGRYQGGASPPTSGR